MVRRRAFLRAATAGAVLPLVGCSGGGSVQTLSQPGGLTVTSRAFADGGVIPARYTADGQDRSPPLSVDSVPNGAETLAVIVDDPDAPGGTFVHWLLWNIPASRRQLSAGIPRTERLPALGGARQGTNGFGSVGYRGPKPPEGDGPHTYRFTVYALDATLEVPAGAKRGELETAMAGHVLATGRLTGEYER